MNKCHIEQFYIHTVIFDNVNWNPVMPHVKNSIIILSHSLLSNLLEEF